MPAERNTFKLGLTMILFFALLVAILVFLAPRGGGDMRIRVRYPHTKMTTVLKPGGMVRCGGDTVGSIRTLDLEEMPDPASGHPALFSIVTIKVDSRLGLRDDCRVIPIGPLLGEGGQLVIQDRGTGKVLADGALIDGTPVSDLTQLMQTLSDQLDPKDPASLLAMIKAQLDATDGKSIVGKVLASLDDLNAVTRQARHEFDPQQKAALLAKLHAVMDHVGDLTRLLRLQMDDKADQALLAKVHKALDSLGDGLQTAVALLRENREPIHQTIANVRDTSEIVEQRIAARLAEQLDPGESAGLLAKVHVAVDRLAASLADVNAITDSARQVVVLNREQINRTIANLKETSDHLNATAKDLWASPWRLLYQPTKEDLAEANTLSAARAFTEAAARLDDTVAKLHAIREQSAAPDEQIAHIREQLQQTFEKYQQVEQTLWKQLKLR